MADHGALELALIEMTRMLLRGYKQADVLHQLCEHVTRAVDVTDAGIAIPSADGGGERLLVGKTTSARAHLIDVRQAELQEGPCRDAYDSGERVSATGVQLLDRWPSLGPFLVDVGLHGAAAVPLKANDVRLGSLDFYWPATRAPLDEDDLEVIGAMAEAASAYIVHGRRVADMVGMYTRQLEAANVELHRSREVAVRANHVKNEFLSRTSHELRTPLNAIMGFAQVLEMTHEDDPTVVEPVGHIRRAGDHLVALIDDVLDIARIEAGDLHLIIEAVAVRELIDTGIRLIAPMADARDVAIVVDADCIDTPPLLADHKRALQVLLNLLSNATKYSREGGAVTIKCAPQEGDRVAISVTDTGPGLDNDQIARLFVPFERLGAERTGIEGTGIGLTLSRALAHRMGGSLTVTSSVGHGSTFTVELPAGTTAQAALTPSR